MSHKISCTWKEDMAFESMVNGHSVMIDADEAFGGKNRGPRPKPLLLTALSGCSGMDVVSILGKMKVSFTFFNIDVEAELTDEQPHYYHTITLIYQFKEADNLDKAKVEKAVNLSQERYCGVAALLKKGCTLKYEIQYM